MYASKYVEKQEIQHEPILPDESRLPYSYLTKFLSPLEQALWNTSIDSPIVISARFGQKTALNDTKKSVPGKYIAIDCEFVGVGYTRSALARVSLVNIYGVILLDTFVKPKERVTDWRTWVSGVSPHHMRNAILFEDARKKVCDLIDGKVIVGHAIHNDLSVLGISHPNYMIRDTARFSSFKALTMGKPPGLKRLARELFDLNIHGKAHSSVEDAQVTMAIFRNHRKEIDSEQSGNHF